MPITILMPPTVNFIPAKRCALSRSETCTTFIAGLTTYNMLINKGIIYYKHVNMKIVDSHQ